MEQLSAFSSLADVLHALSQGLLVPDIILLLAFACYALFCIGSIVMEYFTERRSFRIAMPKFLNSLMQAEEGEIPEVIRASGLLNRQKSALLTVYDYRTLHDDALLALIRRIVYAEEKRYDSITGRNNTAAKISPMLGLMGTLIPLGPGVAALGQADPSALSASLLVAFDTTVAGLAVAAVCLAVGKIRSNWYGDYLSTLESAMATMLQKIEDMRAAGTLRATEPTDYAAQFEAGLHAEAASKAQPSDTRREQDAPHHDAPSPSASAEQDQAGAHHPATTSGLAAEPAPSAFTRPADSDPVGMPAWQRSPVRDESMVGQASTASAAAPSAATQAPAATPEAAPSIHTARAATSPIAGYTTIPAAAAGQAAAAQAQSGHMPDSPAPAAYAPQEEGGAHG